MTSKIVAGPIERFISCSSDKRICGDTAILSNTRRSMYDKANQFYTSAVQLRVMLL